MAEAKSRFFYCAVAFGILAAIGIILPAQAQYLVGSRSSPKNIDVPVEIPTVPVDDYGIVAPLVSKITTCSGDKVVKLHKFCIDGEDEGEPGSEMEIHFTVGGEPYIYGFHDIRMDSCKNLEPMGAYYKKVISNRSLSVGIREYDATSEDESAMVNLTAEEWYNPTCEIYEVQFTHEFEGEVKKNVCWNVGGSVTASGNLKGVELEGTIEGGYEDCSSFEIPAKSYLWLMEVVPVELAAEGRPRKLGNDVGCLRSAECQSGCCSNTVGDMNTCEEDTWWRSCV